MLTVPTAVYAHHVCLNKMKCVVTEGAGIHWVVDLGHFIEDVILILYLENSCNKN